MLEVRPGGKTYYIRMTGADGRLTQRKIARTNRISFDQVRKAAKPLLAESALGGDPSAKQKEARAIPTFAEVAAQHVDHARTCMRSIKTLEGYMRRILRRWGRMSLTDIRQLDVAAWLAGLREERLAPATVDKVRVTMNRTFELGARWQVAGAVPNSVHGVPRLRFDNARERTVAADEVALLVFSLRSITMSTISSRVSGADIVVPSLARSRRRQSPPPNRSTWRRSCTTYGGCSTPAETRTRTTGSPSRSRR